MPHRIEDVLAARSGRADCRDLAERPKPPSWKSVARGAIHWIIQIGVDFLMVGCKGRGSIPRSGNFVAVANHASYLDHFILYCEIKRATHKSPVFLAKKEYWKSPLSRLWCELWNMVPVDRTGSGHAIVKESLDRAKHLLRQGEIVVIYPEGTRTRTGEMLPFKNGAVWIAKDCHVPILPIGVAGVHDVLPPGKVWPNVRRRLAVSIGEPIAPEQFAETPKQTTAHLRAVVARLHAEARNLVES